MKRFSFRLERVLWLRALTEKERARDLGSALQTETARRRTLEDAYARLNRCGDQIAANRDEVQTAGTMRNLGLTVAEAAGHLEAAATSHLEATEKVVEEEDRYCEARKDRRVLERLRERRQTLWNLESSREEQRDIDSQARQRRAAGEQE